MATGGGGNAMVKSELEAAEALAGLAKTESLPPQHNSVSNRNENRRLYSDSPDEAVGARRQCENINSIILNKNVDQDIQLHKPSATGSRGHTCISGSKSIRKMTEDEKEARKNRRSRGHSCTSGSKSRQTMTEDEKEARKIRRVLANRESARQTIRRRQALYEELISKAASLVQENESLKREMDLAVQEYDYLKTTNKSLKLQMVKAVSTELDEIRADKTPKNTETSKSTCPNCPFIIYNQTPPFPFMWPAFVQPPNAMQTQNGINLLTEQANFEKKKVPNPPLYILPCPIFYPVSDQGTGVPLLSSFDSRNDQIAAPMSYSYACSSSTKTVECRFEEVKGEASSSKTCHGVPSKLVKPIASVKPVTCQQSEINPNDRAFGSSSPNTSDTVKEKKLDLNVCPIKKKADAVAAAEARKRRKELTMLKSLHFRDFGRA